MTIEEENKNKTRQHWIIVALILLFSSPFVGSWILFNYTELGQGGTAKYNYGNLIQPPRQLPNMVLNVNGSEQTKPLHGKWSFVYLAKGSCEEECERNLYRMRQIRLTAGKHAHRIQRVLLSVDSQPVTLSTTQQKEYPGQLFGSEQEEAMKQFSLTEDDKPFSAGRLYIVDPMGFLVISYEANEEPAGMINDIKRLLRYSSAG